jgi:hypothetical protein
MRGSFIDPPDYTVSHPVELKELGLLFAWLEQELHDFTFLIKLFLTQDFSQKKKTPEGNARNFFLSEMRQN